MKHLLIVLIWINLLDTGLLAQSPEQNLEKYWESSLTILPY